MKTRASLLLTAAMVCLGGTTHLTIAQNVPPVGNTEEARERRAMSGIVHVDGKTYLVKDGRATVLDKDMTLTVRPDGGITGLDGQARKLPERSMMTMDGRMIQMPPGIISNQPRPTEPPAGVLNPSSSATTPAVSGENLSGLAPANTNRVPSEGTAQSGATATMPAGERRTNNPNATPASEGNTRDRDSGSPNNSSAANDTNPEVLVVPDGTNANPGNVNTPATANGQMGANQQNQGQNTSQNGAQNQNTQNGQGQPNVNNGQGGAQNGQSTQPNANNAQGNMQNGQAQPNANNNAQGTMQNGRRTNNPNAVPSGSNGQVRPQGQNANPNNSARPDSARPNSLGPEDRPSSSNTPQTGNQGSNTNSGSGARSGGGSASGGSGGSGTGGSGGSGGSGGGSGSSGGGSGGSGGGR